MLLLVLVETPKEGHVAIEGAELGEGDGAVERINDAGIELAHHIQQTRSRAIEVPSAHIAGVGKEVILDGATSRPDERESKIVPGEEWIGGDSSDRQPHLICRKLD